MSCLKTPRRVNAGFPMIRTGFEMKLNRPKFNPKISAIVVVSVSQAESSTDSYLEFAINGYIACWAAFDNVSPTTKNDMENFAPP